MSADTKHRMVELRDEIERLTKERDEAREWALKSVREVEARERIMTCVWCAHQYPPMTPAAQAPILYKHAKVCPKSPLRDLVAALEKAELNLYEAADLMLDTADRDATRSCADEAAAALAKVKAVT